ncbi:sensor histidine kinase [Natrononativus amylolyticus]|uniref:sensor histidine kinase n=1 Tax=Natrononativus amylolyticus TaxID=2963434 RepID=UPI0020CE09A9|nr:HAMP domain-containing sensor histidine kinase [Natrononativus amylolyticus]
MVHWSRLITALGGLFVVIAAWRVIFSVVAGTPFTTALIDFVQIGLLGLALLYGGYRLPKTGLDPATYPRIVAWCLAAVGVMTVAISLRIVDPGATIEGPLWSAALAMALGGLIGLAIGVSEAQAVTRAREAEQHKQQLQQQNDRLEGFSKMLAHELRNPLSIAQLHLRAVAEGDDEAFDRVDHAHERIDEIISVLLLTARTGETATPGELIAIADAATDAWADVDSPSATLVVETEQSIRVDPVHFHHLLENLFKNAVDHGGDDVTVRVGDLEDGFFVADDGPGIPPEDHEAVVDAGYTTAEDGIGFGLSFVTQIADAYDWEFTVTESDSGGAQFECTAADVPVSEETPQRS